MASNTIFVTLLKTITDQLETENLEDCSCDEVCNIMFSHFSDKNVLEIISIMKNVIENKNSPQSSINLANIFLQYTVFKLLIINKSEKEIIEKQLNKVKQYWDIFNNTIDS